jgi:hypothetical protein
VFETDEALDPTMDKMQRFGDVEPTFTVRIQERYALTLEPRRYVLCDRRLEGCANLELGEGEVFTVNVRLSSGRRGFRCSTTPAIVARIPKLTRLGRPAQPSCRARAAA